MLVSFTKILFSQLKLYSTTPRIIQSLRTSIETHSRTKEKETNTDNQSNDGEILQKNGSFGQIISPVEGDIITSLRKSGSNRSFENQDEEFDAGFADKEEETNEKPFDDGIENEKEKKDAKNDEKKKEQDESDDEEDNDSDDDDDDKPGGLLIPLLELIGGLLPKAGNV